MSLATVTPEANGNGTIRLNISWVVAIAGTLFSFIMGVGGMGVVFIKSNTKAEIDTANLIVRMDRLEGKLDGYAVNAVTASERLARIETTNQNIKQSIDRLELAAVPTRGR